MTPQEQVIAEARRFIERTATIGEDHPAYGFLVMGIPLAKAIAALDAAPQIAISDIHVSETDVILTVTPADAKKVEALIRERDEARAEAATAWRCEKQAAAERDEARADLTAERDAHLKADQWFCDRWHADHARIAELEAALRLAAEWTVNSLLVDAKVADQHREAMATIRAALRGAPAQPATAAKEECRAWRQAGEEEFVVTGEPCDCSTCKQLDARNGAAPPSPAARIVVDPDHHVFVADPPPSPVMPSPAAREATTEEDEPCVDCEHTRARHVDGNCTDRGRIYDGVPCDCTGYVHPKDDPEANYLCEACDARLNDYEAQRHDCAVISSTHKSVEQRRVVCQHCHEPNCNGLRHSILAIQEAKDMRRANERLAAERVIEAARDSYEHWGDNDADGRYERLGAALAALDAAREGK